MYMSKSAFISLLVSPCKKKEENMFTFSVTENTDRPQRKKRKGKNSFLSH